MNTYPDSLPLAEAQDVIKLLTGTSTKPDNKAIVRDLWVVTGYLLRVLVGEPAADGTASALDYTAEDLKARVSEAEGATILALLVEHETRAKTAEASASFFDGGFITKQLAKILLPLLISKLQDFVVNGGLQKLIENVIAAKAIEGAKCCGDRPCCG